jgi:hypothetical protein
MFCAAVPLKSDKMSKVRSDIFSGGSELYGMRNPKSKLRIVLIVFYTRCCSYGFAALWSVLTREVNTPFHTPPPPATNALNTGHKIKK